jgi:hypothetical protein
MEAFIEKYCDYFGLQYEHILQTFNNCEDTGYLTLNGINDYKKHVCEYIYKEDMPTLFAMWEYDDDYEGHIISYEDFMKKSIEIITYNNLNINNLSIGDCLSSGLCYYYLGTFLEHKPVDIKIALK